jgi:glycosyltransferase involved in cell wall biosynthesis
MSKETPKISVIIPTYNRAHVLKRAIDSVLNQTFSDFEIIVVDDGSTDDTQKLLKQYDDKLKVITTENRGVSAARNIAIKDAKGKYIAGLDSDDYWHKRKLERQIEALESRPDIKIIYTNEIWIRNGKRVNQCKQHQKYSGHIYKKCLPLCIISPSSVVMERSIFDDIGLFDEDLPACEDYDLWLRVASKYEVFFLDEELIYKTGGHEDQLSHKYWGMDRFRVTALQKALNLDLSDGDKKATVEMLKEKCRVLILGFEKRGKVDEAKIYRDIRESF